MGAGAAQALILRRHRHLPLQGRQTVAQKPAVSVGAVAAVVAGEYVAFVSFTAAKITNHNQSLFLLFFLKP